MDLSESLKSKMVENLIEVYGRDFKTPLSVDLGVDVSTVRRLFNQRSEIPKRYLIAINKIIGERNNESSKRGQV